MSLNKQSMQTPTDLKDLHEELPLSYKYEPLKYGLLRVNSKLVTSLFSKIFEFIHIKRLTEVDPVYVDFEVYPNQFLITQRTQKVLRAHFDPFYFSKSSPQYKEETLKQYLLFKKRVYQKVIKKGSIVKLVLDGEYYEVEDIDPQKKLATISKKNSNNIVVLTLKVDLNNILLSNLDPESSKS